MSDCVFVEFRVFTIGKLFGLSFQDWARQDAAKVADFSPAAIKTILRVYSQVLFFGLILPFVTNPFSQDFAAFGYSSDPRQHKLPPSGGPGYIPGGHALRTDYGERLAKQTDCNHRPHDGNSSLRCWGYYSSLLPHPATSQWSPQEVVARAAAARSQIKVRDFTSSLKNK